MTAENFLRVSEQSTYVENLRRTVDHGAAFFDAQFPGWRKKMDPTIMTRTDVGPYYVLNTVFGLDALEKLFDLLEPLPGNAKHVRVELTLGSEHVDAVLQSLGFPRMVPEELSAEDMGPVYRRDVQTLKQLWFNEVTKNDIEGVVVSSS